MNNDCSIGIVIIVSFKRFQPVQVHIGIQYTYILQYINIYCTNQNELKLFKKLIFTLINIL